MNEAQLSVDIERSSGYKKDGLEALICAVLEQTRLDLTTTSKSKNPSTVEENLYIFESTIGFVKRYTFALYVDALGYDVELWRNKMLDLARENAEHYGIDPATI